MEADTTAIGTRIKTRRKELGLTQLDIKAAAGISSGNLSDIENGNRLPAATTLIQLAAVLSCSADWILTGKQETSEKTNLPTHAETEQEATLVQGFRMLSPQNREEILDILQMKLRNTHGSDKAVPHSERDRMNDGMAG